MSRGKWRRDEITGLPLTVLERLEADAIDLPDCNIFGWQQIAEAAGASNVSRFRKRALLDGRFHHHNLRDLDGHNGVVATHINSAAAFGEWLRQEARVRSLGNLRRGPARFDLAIRGRGRSPRKPKNG
jgi:hypothetical protein